jgi:hypothetical protein
MNPEATKRNYGHADCIMRSIIYSLLSFSPEPLLSCLLSKNLIIKIYKTIILSVVLNGRETCSLTLREGHRLRTGRWGEYFERKEMKWREVGENYIIRNFITCTLHNVWLKWPRQCGWDDQGGVTRMEEKKNAYTILLGKPDGKRPLGRPRRK